MASTTPPDPWPLPELHRARRAIVVVDVVESVRLMQEDESGFIDRWRRFVHAVRTEVLPAHGGRMVKSLGDGMLLEFDDVSAATVVAIESQQRSQRSQRDHLSPHDYAPLSLRVGVHCADVVLDDLDMFGSGVNLASRLASLAGPGEIVVSVEVRDQLLAGVDAEIEDLGDCFVKHLDQPVRAFRIAAAGSPPQSDERQGGTGSDLRPTIVVLPLRPLAAGPNEVALGEIVADDLISALARSAHWNVVSRLSSCAPRAQGAELAELRRLFNASHVLSGNFRCGAGQARLTLELADTRDERVVWSHSEACALDALFAGESDALDRIVAQVSAAVLSKDLARAGALALPSLEGYAVLMQGVSLMHRMSPTDSERASNALHHVMERHPRAPEPRAWLGKWYVMRVAQAWTTDPRIEAGHARAVVARALDMAPAHSLSLAIDGLVYAMVDRDLETAQVRYEQALAANPNEAHAWLFLSSVHAHRGAGAQAQACMARARVVSPIDPLDYFYDVFDAWAALAAGAYADAERLALRSYRLNRCHLPTYTVLAAAHALAGHEDDARQAGRRMLELRPAFSVDRFVALFPGGSSAYAQRLGDALGAAGLPR